MTPRGQGCLNIAQVFINNFICVLILRDLFIIKVREVECFWGLGLEGWNFILNFIISTQSQTNNCKRPCY